MRYSGLHGRFLVFNRHRSEELHGLQAVEDSGESALLALRHAHNKDIKFRGTCDQAGEVWGKFYLYTSVLVQL